MAEKRNFSSPTHQPPFYQPLPQLCPTAPAKTDQIVQQVVVGNPAVGKTPAKLMCPSCRQEITTHVRYEASTRTHIIAILMCHIACCCCPYLCKSCKNADHYCSGCGSYVGTYHS